MAFEISKLVTDTNNNWLGLPVDDVVKSILSFIKSLEIITV